MSFKHAFKTGRGRLGYQEILGCWTQLPRSGRSLNCRMCWISNRCISELCPVSFQNCKDPRLTFHKDLGGGAHTHPTVLVTKINCVSKEVSGHVSKVILRWFLLWKMFRILKLGPKAIAQQTTTFKSPYNNPLLHCAVFPYWLTKINKPRQIYTGRRAFPAFIWTSGLKVDMDFV